MRGGEMMDVLVETKTGSFSITEIKEIKVFYDGKARESFTSWDEFIFFSGFHYVFIGKAILSVEGKEINSVLFD